MSSKEMIGTLRRITFNRPMILAGDIGGTKVNLGLFELRDGRLKLAKNGSFPSRRYVRLQELVKEFLATAEPHTIQRACFGVAGPVRNGQVQVTNLPWKVEAGELAQELNLGSASIINDLEANGYGLAELSPEDLRTLNEGEPGASGNAAIISAGTGLGEAGLFWDGEKHRPFACEGGHADFAPITKLDAELFGYLSDRFGRVSSERLLSGTGLFNIYQFLRDTKRGDEPASLAEEISIGDPAAVISQAALAGESSRCTQALSLFVFYYGAEAGNLALKLMATGGVYIGGGIAPKILARLQQGDFLTAFFSKGRMRPLLEAIPVRVVLNPATALLGAAHYAAYGPQSIANPLAQSA
ncbi:MAG: glk [Pedosphaera sp.]|nr:glk [Pedosphaera sp.]